MGRSGSARDRDRRDQARRLLYRSAAQMPKSKTPEPQALQSIDPADLENVGGGVSRASSSGGSSEITAALTGVMDALSSLKNQKSSGGMDPMAMMMMMMMMGGGGGGAPQAVQQQAGTIGGYAGYTIDGVFYPFQ